MASFLGDLFSGAPTTAFDAYSNTANALNKLRGQRIANALNQIKLNYAPQMAQQAADTGAADVSIEQNKAKYAPQLSQAALGLRNAQIVQEHAQTIATNLLARGRQLDNVKKFAIAQGAPESVQNNLELQKAKIQAQLAHVTSVATSADAEKRRQGALYQFQQTVKTIPAKDRGAYIASHAPALEQILTTNLNQANAQNPGSPQPVMQADNAPEQPGQNQQPEGQQNQAAAPQPSPLESASKFNANKGSVSAYATKRLDNSIEIEKFLQSPQTDLYAAAAAKYAGIVGKGKAAVEAWKRDNPEDYEKNIFFRNQFKSVLTNLNKNLEGLGVQVSQREELTNNIMQSFDQYSSNPERAWDQWQKTKQIFHDIGRSNSVAAQPVFPGAREKAAGLSYDNHEDLDKMVDIKVNGKRASIPLKNLQKALERPGVKMDLGD